ncbi:MAG: glycosyltransferase family 25 protein [Methylococcales bacterium]|nr:glycosyltransferase family 25 protein [Methylococcales bacterium]
MPNIEKHLKKIEITEKSSQISGIDYIYLINLDRRPEKLAKSIQELRPFQINPQRVSAIYGWTLSKEAFDDIGMKFVPPMDFSLSGQVFFRLASDQLDAGEPVNASSYGKTCVHQKTSAGSIGGSLSHLSCLQHAFDAGFETIWILEDDFTVMRDPHELSTFIKRLDTLVGADSWDMLYTDDDHHFMPYGEMNLQLRPDRAPFRHRFEHTPIGTDFMKIGGRWQLHSIIYRRSGMKKILDHMKQFGLFHTLDVEINFTPNIQMYNLTCGLVHGRNRTVSDTQRKFF